MMVHSIVHSTGLLAAEATEGGLFDFDATLPIIAIQFLLLVAVLNTVFYQRLTKTIDDRNDYIRLSLSEAQERKAKAEELTRQYQAEIGQARVKAQQVIAEAEASALKIRSQRLAEVQAEVKAKMEAARATVEQEKAQALQTLQQQVAVLSQQMVDKLLGAVR
jgi:F-type H+-transporting ATPase subunit b